jgi:hypothetical protein
VEKIMKVNIKPLLVIELNKEEAEIFQQMLSMWLDENKSIENTKFCICKDLNDLIIDKLDL